MKKVISMVLSVMLIFTGITSVPMVAYAEGSEDSIQKEETPLETGSLYAEEVPEEDISDTWREAEEPVPVTEEAETDLTEEAASDEASEDNAEESVGEAVTEEENLETEAEGNTGEQIKEKTEQDEESLLTEETEEKQESTEAASKEDPSLKKAEKEDPLKEEEESPEEGLIIILNGTDGTAYIDRNEYALTDGENPIKGITGEEVEANVFLEKNATAVEINGTKYNLIPGTSTILFSSVPAAGEIKITAGTEAAMRKAISLKAAPVSGTGSITAARSIGSGYNSSWEFDVSFSGNTYTGFCIDPYNENIALSGSTSLTLASGDLRRAAYYAYLNYSSWGTAGRLGIHRQLAYYAGYGDDRTGYTDYDDSPEAVAAFVNGSTAVPSEFEAYISIPANGGQVNIVYRMGEKPEGEAYLVKSPSKCSKLVNELDTYTLAGAKYEVRNSQGRVVHTFTTKADGKTDRVSLPAGKYTVKEVSAPQGFRLDIKSYTLNVENGKTAKLEVKDDPKLDPIRVLLKKVLAPGVTDSSISLKGAEYTFKYYDTLGSITGRKPTRTWVFATDEKGIVRYDDSYKVSGDSLFKNDSGIPVGAIGTYVIEETKAPMKLALSGTEHTVKLDGTLLTDGIMDFAYPTDEEKPQTVSLTIHKVDKDTGKATAQGNGSLKGAVFNVYFTDPSKGEVKVDTITTNAKGEAVSKNLEPGLYSVREVTASPGYLVNPDKFDIQAKIKEINTANFNYVVTVPEQPVAIEIAKLAYDKDGKLYNLQGATLQLLDSKGNVVEEWKTTEKVKMFKGIVPGEYTIVEKEAPEGFHKLLNGVDIEVKQTEEVQHFEMINESDIKIKTLAKFDTGIKESLPDGTVTVVDEVEYIGTLPDHPYRFIGKIVNPETDEVIAEGKTDFTADGVSGTTTVTYTFDAGEFENTAPVIYEYLYRLNRDPKGDNGNNEDTELVGWHESPDDADQTIYFPYGSTSAFDIIDDEKDMLASGEQTIVDIFHYENLEPNSEKTVSGKLMVKSTGEALKVNGKEVTAEATFTTTKSGTGDVRLEFLIEDASVLNGEDIVAFERVKNNGIDVIVHEDIEDENQTVHFPKIMTTALDTEDDEKDMFAGGIHTVKDIVEYSNLLAGKEYTLTGTAYVVNADESMGESLGTGTLVFTPEEKDGEAIVEIEIDTTGLDGRNIVIFEELKRGDKTVGLHIDPEDENQTIYIPEIHTTATDKTDGGKEIIAAPAQTVVDEIGYENLIPGKTYVAHGVFHIVNEDGTDGGILTVNGKEVTAEAEFTPEKPEGTVKVEFTFDASTLQGETLVAFEEVTRNGKTVAVHADIEDEAQTIHVPEIRTKALDKESGTNKVVPYWENTVVDTVTYKNLTPGETYDITGVLVKKADGTETGITGKATFIPEEKNGEVEVTFTFDGTTVEGTTLVVFEELIHNGKTIAEHKDITDKDQTVIIKPIGKLTITDKPDFSNYLSPKTGDPGSILIYIGMMLTALMILMAVLKKKSRKAYCVILVISLFLCGSVLAFAGEDGYLTKEYPFTQESEEDLSYEAPERITEEGRTYKLESVEYEVRPSEDVVNITKEITVKDPKEFESEITEAVEGKTYTLKAEEPKWEKKEVKNKKKPSETLTKEYPYGDPIPETATENGKVFTKQEEQTLSRTEIWQAPAAFATSDTNCRIYSFDGKLITIPGEEPVWDGYTDDIRDYLGISGNDYSITGIAWDGGFSGTEGSYTRTATVSGTRTVYYNLVTYTYQEEPEPEYEYSAKVTYTDKNADTAAVNAVAVARYSEVKPFPVKEAVAAGIAVLALALSSILYVLAKKKKKKEEQTA